MTSTEPRPSEDAAPPVSGAYEGRLVTVVSWLPPRVTSVLVESGGMASLLGRSVYSAVRHPRGYWNDVIEDMADTLRTSWFSIFVALFGFLISLSVPAIGFLKLAGVTELYGPILLVHSTRTFTVWVATLLIAGVVGAAATAELGSRKVREELDAMIVMGIDPIRTLVVPRIVSITLTTMLLAMPAFFITIVTSHFASVYIGGIPTADFYDFLWLALSPTELIAMVVNCALAGILVATVCCYKGLKAQGGATGLGQAVNQAVVTAFVALFVMQLGFTAVVLGLFPGLGELR